MSWMMIMPAIYKDAIYKDAIYKDAIYKDALLIYTIEFSYIAHVAIWITIIFVHGQCHHTFC